MKLAGDQLLPGYKIWFNPSNSILYKYIKRKNNCYKYKDKQRQRNPNVQQYAFKVHSNTMENTQLLKMTNKLPIRNNLE